MTSLGIPSHHDFEYAGLLILADSGGRINSPGRFGWLVAETRGDRGLPQESPISPLLANLYLDTFDEELLDPEIPNPKRVL